jgi:hypothetical protein
MCMNSDTILRKKEKIINKTLNSLLIILKSLNNQIVVKYDIMFSAFFMMRSSRETFSR